MNTGIFKVVEHGVSCRKCSQKAHGSHVWWDMPVILAVESKEGESEVQEVTPSTE